MQIAITREVSRSISECELTYIGRAPIDIRRAREQHARYEQVLREMGLAVLALPEEPELPDAVFVEDTALVVEECAVLLRPGAVSRQAEVSSVGHVLGKFRALRHMQEPANVDGGDILRLERRVFIGTGQRTNLEAVEQIRSVLRPLGYSVEAIQVRGCLHLKSAATQVGPGKVLINPAWIDADVFGDVECIEVEPSEAYAANALCLGEAVLFPEAFPRTAARLEHTGVRISTLAADELAKAEGALTCCSLILEI